MQRRNNVEIKKWAQPETLGSGGADKTGGANCHISKRGHKTDSNIMLEFMIPLGVNKHAGQRS